MVTPRVTRALNPQRKRKLSLKQIRAGFGGKRRQASLKGSKRHTHKRRAAAKTANPKRKRRATAKAKNSTKTRIVYRTKTKYRTKKVYVKSKPRRKANPKRRRSSNPGPYILTMAPVGNPHKKRRKTSMAKTKRKASARGRSGKRRNPTRRRSVARRGHRSRNPMDTGLVKKAAGVFVGFSACKKLPPMLGASMNSSPMMTLLSTAITAAVLAMGVKKFYPGQFAEGIMWGGLGGTFNAAWNAFAPTQIAQYWPGVGDFVPGQFPLPQQPVRYIGAAPAMAAPPANATSVNMGAWGSSW